MSGKETKGPKEDAKLSETHEGICLHITNPEMARQIYAAIQDSPNFRVVVDGQNVVSVPELSETEHDPADTVLFSDKDLEWDDAGCLVIKDHHLGQQIVTAQATGCFRISMNKNDVSGSSGTIEGNKVNGMCNC